MRIIKVFKRENRSWVGDIVIERGKFVFRKGKDAKTGFLVERSMFQVIRKKPRKIHSVLTPDGVTEFTKDETLIASPENFQVLVQEMSWRLPLLRFVGVEESEMNEDKLKAELKYLVESASYLTAPECKKAIEKIDAADLNELILIKDDLAALDRLQSFLQTRQP